MFFWNHLLFLSDKHTGTQISILATSISGVPPFSATSPPFLVFPGKTQSIIVVPTTFIFVDSAGVSRKISKLLARFYQYKKRIASNMDPLPRVSVDATHPALTVCRCSGKAEKEPETPQTRTSPPRLAKAISATTCSTGLARAALARSMGSASASGSVFNPPHTAPLFVGIAVSRRCRSAAVRGEQEQRQR